MINEATWILGTEEEANWELDFVFVESAPGSGFDYTFDFNFS